MPECIVSRYAILNNAVFYARYFMVEKRKWLDNRDHGAQANCARYRHKKNRSTAMSPLAFGTLFVGVQSPIICINITEPAVDDSKWETVEIVSNEMNNTYQTVQTDLPTEVGDGFVEKFNSLEIETHHEATDIATNAPYYLCSSSAATQSANREQTIGTENEQRRRRNRARRQSGSSSTGQGEDGGDSRDSREDIKSFWDNAFKLM